MSLRDDAHALKEIADASERQADAAERIADAAQEIAAAAPAIRPGDYGGRIVQPGTGRTMGSGGGGGGAGFDARPNGARESIGGRSGGGVSNPRSRPDRPWQVTGPITGALTGPTGVNDPAAVEVRGLRQDLRGYFGGPGPASTARRR